MENNNPYRPDYHEYLESLKKNLENTNSYVNTSNDIINYPVYAVDKKKNILKYSFIILATLIVGVSVVSFFTQSVLLVLNKNNNKNNVVIENKTLSDQQQVEDELKKLYVRADIGKNIFGTSTEVATNTEVKENKKETFDLAKYFNVNIPGVQRIGFLEEFGNQFLSDNINKYSQGTLVIGDRGNAEEVGGNDELMSDKYEIIPKAISPILSSKAYMMADLETGEIIIEKNADTIYPLASVSKLMTAVVATEKMNLNDVAIVSRDASDAYGAQGALKLGEKIILSDLIYPLLMESSNDAAEVFADHFGHQAFMDEMNKKARSLEMYDTYYGDPSGLDPKNTSTPNDLLKLVRYIWKTDPSIFATTRVKQFSIKGHTWYNRNAQLPLAGFVGGKNGFIDQALQTTASIFEIPTLKGGNRKVVIIILKSADKNGDVNKLIKFLKTSVVYTP